MFPLINIAGLTIGLTVVLLICAFIFNEYSFDQSFTHHARTYRVNSYLTTMMAGRTINLTPSPMALAVKEAIPEVEEAVRVFEAQTVVKVDNTPYKVKSFCWADSGFFHIFDMPFVHGSAERALARPGTVAISESQARVMFGGRDPIGEIITAGNNIQLEVSGVYRDLPANVSFDFQMIGHYLSGPEWIRTDQWGNLSFETYCMLTPGAKADTVQARMERTVTKAVGEPFFLPRLQPLDRLHLHSKDYMYIPTDNVLGDVKRVRMFSLLAAIILLVACINYMNLSTARAQKRSKEIGISKTLGAKRRSIITRLYLETGLLTLMAFVLAFALMHLLCPSSMGLRG
jgi:uncharacterized protein YjlB